ncbi:MAG: sigma-54-dependent Fis family transcriptional regulator, partial [Kyrpidia sp.]|nr:sigma-54-dependent Fis family transcriptional regulator [Kyrpidia sp.]
MCARNLILRDSWWRSREYGVQTDVLVEDILEPPQLKILKEEKEQLLQVVTPAMERLHGWVYSQHSTVMVSHVNGYILYSVGDPKFMSDAQKIHLKEGAGWSERSRGTNAIGTAAAVREPVSVVGGEHYCTVNRFLYCAAAPVFDTFGRLEAIIDVSGYCNEYHPSTVHLVDFVSRQVEDELLLRNPGRGIVFELRPEEDRAVRALIALNEEGRVVGANREGRRMLNLSEIESPHELPVELKNLNHALLGVSFRSFHSQRIQLEFPERRPQWYKISVLADNRPIQVSAGPVSKGKRGGADTASRMTSPELHYIFSDIYCRDPAFSRILDVARRVAGTEYPVLVIGESGTGKEMVSQAIHAASPRRSGPFVAINCGAIPPTLLHSELFGYEPGAFTGADRARRLGKFELAQGGTLFLDEVADMPIEMQVALLRVLQEGVLTRIGGTEPVPVDVRIIAASNEDLWARVQQGDFREDLYFRLLGVELRLPPLRARQDRIGLAEHFLERIGKEQGIPDLKLSPAVKRMMEEYPWPGNVRELYAVLRQAAFFAEGGEIRIEHLPVHMADRQKKGKPRP